MTGRGFGGQLLSVLDHSALALRRLGGCVPTNVKLICSEFWTQPGSHKVQVFAPPVIPCPDVALVQENKKVRPFSPVTEWNDKCTYDSEPPSIHCPQLWIDVDLVTPYPSSTWG